MTEKFPGPKSAIEEVPGSGVKYVVNGEEYTTTPEQEELAAAYAAEHSTEATPEMPQECAEKIAELETLFNNFEQAHDLDALLAIDRMTVEEAKAHVGRQAARADLPPIVALTNYVEAQMFAGVVSEDVWSAMYARYCSIQRAIGTLNGDFLIHDRP
jgi:hypothetical protein